VGESYGEEMYGEVTAKWMNGMNRNVTYRELSYYYGGKGKERITVLALTRCSVRGQERISAVIWLDAEVEDRGQLH
jgi:hypothetical protein